MRGQTQESRDPFELVILHPYPAFSVAAGSTLLAFEGFHEKCLKRTKVPKMPKVEKGKKGNHENTKSRKHERKK